MGTASTGADMELNHWISLHCDTD